MVQTKAKDLRLSDSEATNLINDIMELYDSNNENGKIITDLQSRLITELEKSSNNSSDDSDDDIMISGGRF